MSRTRYLFGALFAFVCFCAASSAVRADESCNRPAALKALDSFQHLSSKLDRDFDHFDRSDELSYMVEYMNAFNAINVCAQHPVPGIIPWKAHALLVELARTYGTQVPRIMPSAGLRGIYYSIEFHASAVRDDRSAPNSVREAAERELYDLCINTAVVSDVILAREQCHAFAYSAHPRDPPRPLVASRVSPTNVARATPKPSATRKGIAKSILPSTSQGDAQSAPASAVTARAAAQSCQDAPPAVQAPSPLNVHDLGQQAGHGTVRLVVKIPASPEPTTWPFDVTVEQSSGDPNVDAAAVRYAKSTKFFPATRNCEPAVAEFHMEVTL